jgi:hypothetical protein
VSADAVAEDSRFAGNGVVLNRIEPTLLRVVVDVLEDVDVDVKLPPNATNILNPVFNPAKVKLTAPRTAIRSAPKPLVAYVDAAALQQLKPGTTSQRGLPLTLPLQNGNASLAVTSVDATFEVQQADSEAILPSIPVAVTFAPGIDWKKYDIQHEPTLTNVTVVGPADKIRAIAEGTLRVKARFEVSEENVSSGTEKQHAPVQYDLPEGVKVKVEDPKKNMIEFTLKPSE